MCSRADVDGSIVRPAKTVYNRFNRWSAQGIWQSIFEAAAAGQR